MAGNACLQKADGKIFHFWATELPMNHVDTVWPHWNLMDFTPDGRTRHSHSAAKVQIQISGKTLPE
jgi:hypothetical protein